MTRRPVVGALLFALAFSACDSGSTAPYAVLASSAAAHANNRHANSARYRDAGAKPATGRSGSAALSVEALIGATGQVTLAVFSARASTPSVPAGILEKLQVKIFDANGRLVGTQNFKPSSDGPTWQAPLSGMPAGGRVQVQANVKGIDARRTDVVTVSGVGAVMAPDLAVTGLVIPAAALTGVPTVLAATIAETGGERGASTNCVLYIDGAAVDRSSNIWVDAGDVVTCAFTRVFVAVGVAAVRVALEDIRPFDGQPANNAAEGALPVSAPSPAAASAQLFGAVNSGTFVAADTFETTWTAPGGSVFLEQRSHSSATGSDYTFNITGIIGATMSFPLTRVEIAENGDGRLLYSARIDDVVAGTVSPGAHCATIAGGDGSNLFLCSYAAGYSVVSLVHSAGTVTYQSADYNRTWNGTGYDESSWVYNDTYGTGTFESVTSAFSVNVQITDGATLYALNGVAPMDPVNVTDVSPRQCVTNPVLVSPVTYSALTCFASGYVFNGFQGMLGGGVQP